MRRKAKGPRKKIALARAKTIRCHGISRIDRQKNAEIFPLAKKTEKKNQAGHYSPELSVEGWPIAETTRGLGLRSKETSTGTSVLPVFFARWNTDRNTRLFLAWGCVAVRPFAADVSQRRAPFPPARPRAAARRPWRPMAPQKPLFFGRDLLRSLGPHARFFVCWRTTHSVRSQVGRNGG